MLDDKVLIRGAFNSLFGIQSAESAEGLMYITTFNSLFGIRRMSPTSSEEARTATFNSLFGIPNL